MKMFVPGSLLGLLLKSVTFHVEPLPYVVVPLPEPPPVPLPVQP